MALLGNPDMIHGQRLARLGANFLVPILSVAFIVGCSSGSEDRGEPSKDPKPSASPSATSDRTKVLEKQAEEALGIGEADDTDDLFVESGLERTSDGIHTRPVLSNGKSYTLAVVCSGAGEVRLTVTVKRPARQTVACDSVPVRQRITDAPAQLEIDVDGLAGSSGIVGWRIDELAK
ncbi:hypothetical protein PV963_20635 [Streptomyces coeruleorubidus]|uniref:hypothetical protein n=1 Tax=Streptomyces coeruleorubidus TaxID=116188 RepID=UPI00237EF801|nr:hypothetical protein [Streptomyces coeruleorubidus]WDV52611.1 hypothetical protein PV963_20635 [Streptomyces coeruleorubidus]